jgi:pimeloyl-ACP methyl ester carboxylesterase
MQHHSRGFLQHIKNPARAPIALATLAAIVFAGMALGYRSFNPPVKNESAEVMLILRGIANAGHPRGQLDDQSALEYARRLGYRGEVLDVAGGTGTQVKMALDRIHNDEQVTALYGFSGGGYAAQRIWSQLDADERARIGKVVVIGAPGVDEDDFPGTTEVVIKKDPPAGHMAGPKALLESLGRS